jgi:hypothetical protein
MLQFYVPEVQGIEEVEDEVDAVSKNEFEKFEEKLRAEEDKLSSSDAKKNLP